jgi:hypothetical protein
LQQILRLFDHVMNVRGLRSNHLNGSARFGDAEARAEEGCGPGMPCAVGHELMHKRFNVRRLGSSKNGTHPASGNGEMRRDGRSISPVKIE